MKRYLGSALLVLSLFAFTLPSANAAVTPGSKCSKVGKTQTYKNKVFTCIKLGKKLYWNNGVKGDKPTPIKSQAPAPVVPPSSSPVSPQVPQKPCGFGSTIPKAISNVTVRWEKEDLAIYFDWDYKNPSFVCPVTELLVELMADGVKRESRSGNETFLLKPDTTRQVLTVTKELNRSIIGIFRTSVTSVCIRAQDKFFNKSEFACTLDVPQYQLNLPAPVITVSPELNGYKVVYTTPTSDVYDAIQIVEYVSSSNSAPIGVDYSATFWGKNNPANVIALNTNSRWIKARFSSKAGIWSDYSTAVFVTPISPIRVL
jgi:hypothetical protein